MRLLLPILYLLYLMVPLVYGYDSRNVSASEFVCGGLIMSFFNSVTQQQDLTDCGKEILYNESQVRPTFIVPKPNLTDLYVIIIVDRDAPSASSPIRSPLRHYAAYNITGNQLLSPGLEPSTIVSTTWFNFSGPQPPAGSGCHRYYGMVYRQDPLTLLNEQSLLINTSDPTNRLNWNFVEWATEQNLTKVGVNYWSTQNMYTRVAGCDANPSNNGNTIVFSFASLVLGLILLVSSMEMTRE